MDIQKKVATVTGALIFAFGVTEALFIHWVGNVNWWIAWFISSASTSAIQLGMKVSENRKLFDVNDRELVRVSALANSLEEKVADLENEIEILKANRD